MPYSIQLHTPHGDFETSLFEIAARVPQRLLKDSQDNEPVFNQFAADDGQPYMRTLPIASMSGDATNALSYILATAASSTPALNKTHQMDAVRKNPTAAFADCSVRVMSREPHITHQDEVQLTQAIDRLKESLLDMSQYQVDSYELNGRQVHAYSRSFDRKTEGMEFETLKYMAVGYANGKKDMYDMDSDGSGGLKLIIEAELFKDMIAAESRQRGRKV